jgi:hypothetical protein
MARDPLETSRLEQLDAALREMFESLCALPTPSRLLSLVEQLDDDPEPAGSEPAARTRKGRGRGGAAS